MMENKKMIFHEPDFAYAQFILGTVKRRFLHDPDKLNNFITLIRDYTQRQESAPTQEQIIRNNQSLFSELNSLFTEENKDLMVNIRTLWDMAAHHNNNNNKPVVMMLDEESSRVVKKECLEFVNKIRYTLSDDKYKAFLEIMKAYQHHKDVDRLQSEADPLLKEHPELEITLHNKFIAEVKHGHSGRPVPDMLASRKRKRDEHELQKSYKKEDKMKENEVAYNRMLCAKDALQKLVKHYLGRNSMGVLAVRDHVSGLDLICLRKEFKSGNGRYNLLHSEQVDVQKAIAEAHEIVRGLNKKMDGITKGWEDDRKKLVISSHEDESKIKMFDWHKYRTTS